MYRLPLYCLFISLHFLTICFTQNVTCIKQQDVLLRDWLRVPQSNPSAIHNLGIELIFDKRNTTPSLNISWAINIDGSIHSINRTRIQMNKEDSFLWTLIYTCRYNPPFTSKHTNYTGLEKLWFHFTSTDAHIEPNCNYIVTAYNLPTPPYNAAGWKLQPKSLQVPGCDDERMKNYSLCLRQLHHVWNITIVRVEDEVQVTFISHSDSTKYEIRLQRGTHMLNYSKAITDKEVKIVQKTLKYSGSCENLAIWISPEFEHCQPVCPSVKRKVGCGEPNKTSAPQNQTLIIVTGCALAVLLGLIALYFWQCTRRSFSRLNHSAASTSLVGVLVVYPPMDSAFQCAVVALADFLQLHGGLDVAIDMWQRASVAEQGTFRWLTSQVERADKVLVVLPPPYAGAGVSADSVLNANPALANYTVPASAQELYSLAVNLAMSSAHDPLLRNKFWVVCLGWMGEKRPMPMELRSCKAFSLPRDLEKLCNKLSSRQGLKWSKPAWRLQPLPSQECQDASRKFKEALLQLHSRCLDCSDI